MRKRSILVLVAMVISALSVVLICGCGGGVQTDSMMLKITSPASGASCSGNQIITASMLNPAMGTAVNFKVNGTTFGTVAPALAMTARLDTLSLGLPNGPVTVAVQSTGNVYTASETLNVSNPRSIYIQDVSGSPGPSWVTVHVRLNNYATVGGYDISLFYNSSKLIIDADSVQRGSGVPLASTFTSDTQGSGMGIVEARVTGNAAFLSGDLLTAKFQIRYSSPSGFVNDIVFTDASLTDTAGSSLAVEAVTGSVITD